MFFTNQGRVFRLKGYRIPEVGKSAKGTDISTILALKPNEQISTILNIGKEKDGLNGYCIFVTKRGICKRISADLLNNIRSNGLKVIALDEGDILVSAFETSGTDKVFIATHNGSAICFHESSVLAIGRAAAGTRGIRLREGDHCVGACSVCKNNLILTVTEHGYGKKLMFLSISEAVRIYVLKCPEGWAFAIIL